MPGYFPVCQCGVFRVMVTIWHSGRVIRHTNFNPVDTEMGDRDIHDGQDTIRYEMLF